MSPTRREGKVGLPGFHGIAMARSREEPPRGEVMVTDEDEYTSSRHREGGDAVGVASTGIAGEMVGVADIIEMVEAWRGKGARA